MKAIKLLYARGDSRDYGWIYANNNCDTFLNRIVGFLYAYDGRETLHFSKTDDGRNAFFCIVSYDTTAMVTVFRILLPKVINTKGEILETLSDYQMKGSARIGCSLEGILFTGTKAEIMDCFTKMPIVQNYLCSIRPFREELAIEGKIDRILSAHNPEEVSISTKDIFCVTPIESSILDVIDYYAFVDDIKKTSNPFNYIVANSCPDSTHLDLSEFRKYGNNCNRPKLYEDTVLSFPESTLRESKQIISSSRVVKAYKSNGVANTKILLSALETIPQDKLENSSISLSIQKAPKKFLKPDTQEIKVSFLDGPLNGKILYSEVFFYGSKVVAYIHSVIQAELKRNGFEQSTSLLYEEIWKYKNEVG